MLVSKTSTKGDRDLCFIIDIDNHISALLQKACHSVQYPLRGVKNKKLSNVL